MTFAPVFRQPLGNSELQVSRIGLGLWPIAGMTTLDVNPADSRATLLAAWDAGLNFWDTAFCYGPNGESERIIAEVFPTPPAELIVATKCGVHWGANGERINDASPSRLRLECEMSLQRLQRDSIDLLYLHSPDRQRPVADSAAAMAELQQSGKARYVGLSNASLAELREFHEVCPIVAYQPRYNMLQRDIELEIVPYCQAQGIAIVAYWPLMKGLLAGKIRRGHVFAAADSRLKYPIFQEPGFERAQRLLDGLTEIAEALEVTVAQLVLAWTLRQPGISVALCGAKRAWQISETAQALSVEIPTETGNQLRDLIQRFDSAANSADS